MHSFLSHLFLLSSVLFNCLFCFYCFVGQYEHTTISPTEASTILSLLPSSSQESQSTTINPTTVGFDNDGIKPSSRVDNNGWGVSVDPVSGRMFYHHPVHGSQWEKPKGWVNQDQTMTTANTSTSDSTAGSGAGSGSGVGSSSGGGAGSGSGWNNAVLPHGWSAAVDPASGRTFYYRTDQPSGTSQWDRPVEPTTVNNNNNLSQLRNNNNSSSSGNLSQHSGSGSHHSNNSNNNNRNNNNSSNNNNNMTRSDKSVGSLYTANSGESPSCHALYYPHNSLLLICINLALVLVWCKRPPLQTILPYSTSSIPC